MGKQCVNNNIHDLWRDDFLVGWVHRNVPESRATPVADVSVIHVPNKYVCDDGDSVVLPRDFLIIHDPSNIPERPASIKTNARDINEFV